MGLFSRRKLDPATAVVGFYVACEAGDSSAVKSAYDELDRLEPYEIISGMAYIFSAIAPGIGSDERSRIRNVILSAELHDPRWKPMVQAVSEPLFVEPDESALAAALGRELTRLPNSGVKSVREFTYELVFCFALVCRELHVDPTFTPTA